MPGKRTRKDTLTGGSGDVKPQQITIIHSSGGPNEFTVSPVLLPISKISAGKDRATIIELLKVEFIYPLQNFGDFSTVDMAYLTTSTSRVDGDVATTSEMVVDAGSTRSMAVSFHNRYGSIIGGQSAAVSEELDHIYDLTDGNGNGLLVATDFIYFVTANVGGTGSISAVVKILYRLFEANLTEYIGILQSQI